MTEFNIELTAFKLGLSVADGGLGKEQHFVNIVNALWGPHNERKKFIFHPWAEKMLWAACHYDTLAVAGCGSSGKTDFFAVWAIVNFLCDPINTMVLVTSTSLKESRKRIWGSIREYWLAVPGLPGKLVDSHGVIRLDDGSGDSSYSEKSGITLIAGEKKNEREAIGKLIGMKNKRVFLIADELSELSEAILGACANLGLNPYFQIVGMSNPNSHYDAFGMLAKPKAGWASVNSEESYEWETELGGYALRFDAEKSPNILEGRVIYPWLPTAEKLDAAKARYGEKSVFYFRMFRGFWCPMGSEQSIYTESDITKSLADTGIVWHSGWTKIAALDPAFTNGGDRSVVMIGKYGRSVEGRWTVFFEKYEFLVEDVTNKAEPRNFQIARKFKELCIREGIQPENTALDSTGAGGPFADIVDHTWGNREVLRVNFSGKATDRPVSANDETPSDEKYVNRVSELWYAGHEFLRCGQIRGIMPAFAKEMTARNMTVVKGSSAKIKVETKTEMKARIGESPDIADAGFILLDLVRERFGAVAQDTVDEQDAADTGKPSLAKVISGLRLSTRTLHRARR
jgi:hypothetical protein